MYVLVRVRQRKRTNRICIDMYEKRFIIGIGSQIMEAEKSAILCTTQNTLIPFLEEEVNFVSGVYFCPDIPYL